MRGRTLLLTAAIATIASVTILAVNGHADRRKQAKNNFGIIGPDVVAWAIGGQNSEDIDYDGSSGGMGGYSMATVSCNWGDYGLNWYGGTNNSPIIMQNMFRLKDGKFEQIGMQSFMKHSFCALSEPGCGDCEAAPCDILGIGCADTYWAGLNLNGDCPRSDVNAFTGEYPYPFTHSPSGPSETRGNLVVPNIDVDPALNAGARYFIEAMYIAAGDNNASYREIGFNSISDPYVLANGPQETIAGDPAIRAWAAIDPNVSIRESHAPGDGLILLASKVTDNGDGTFDYDYAIHNLNCHRSIGSIEIPTGSAAISNVGFKDINYNSGEIYDSTDWSSAVLSGSVNWNTVTYEENPNGNALRWGTMYNYSFTASASPVVGNIQLGLFKPGGPDYFSMSTSIPGGAPVDPCDLPLGSCPEDVDGDSMVAVGDILAIVGNFGDCGDGTYRPVGDVDGDCCVSVSDLLAVVGAWGNDCTPVGACCLSGGGCSDGMTETACLAAEGDYAGDDSTCETTNCPQPGACCFDDGSCASVMSGDCSELGGGFQGEGSDCASANCPVAGAGDECSSALIALNGANEFETNTATPSEGSPSESQCPGTYLDWDNSADIWFLYVPSASGIVQFTTCDSNSYDTSMVLYENNCYNQVACNGDGDGGNDCQAYYSEIDYDVNAGESYYIRIGGYQGDTGPGTLTIE
ncbi:MAG: hypothetical protein ACKVIO_04655 [Phycisphaerales bacterium]